MAYKPNSADLERAARAVVLLHDGSSGSTADHSFALEALKNAVIGPASGPIVPDHMRINEKAASDRLDALIERLEGDGEAREMVRLRQEEAAANRHALKDPSVESPKGPVETLAAVSEIDSSKTPVIRGAVDTASTAKPAKAQTRKK